MGPRLVCVAKPDEAAVSDLEEKRRNRLRDLILEAHKEDMESLPQDSSLLPSFEYDFSVPPLFPFLCPYVGRGPPSVRLLHFPVLKHKCFLKSLQKDKVETDLDFIRNYVPFLSAEELDSLQVQTDVTPGSYAQVQMVTFNGRIAIRKVMVSDCFLELLLREARVLLELDGVGGAPRVLALCTDPPAIVLEFVGDTFREFVSECRSVSLLIDTLAKVCDRVHEIHNQGLVHCDLKANNITVSGELHNPDVHIIDFGLATPIGQAFDSKFAGIDFHNKREYLRQWMSPEMKAGLPLHPSSDVYSLGVLMIRMAVMANRSWLTSAMTPLLLACTHPDPEERPAVPDIAAYLRDLKVRAEHEDTSSHMASRWSCDVGDSLGKSC